jgi:hypothetical protein
MEIKKFLVILGISLIIYFVLDFIFNNIMLYIVGGVVGGTISAGFKAVGIKAGMFLISLVWVLLLIGIMVLFYRSNNTVLKYFLVILIAILLYIIDMFVANIPYSDTTNLKTITIISNIIVGFLILFKSLILSLIIYTGIIKN